MTKGTLIRKKKKKERKKRSQKQLRIVAKTLDTNHSG